MKFFVNNIKVPVSESLQIKFFNPLFNDTGSYSFPFTFPARDPLVQKALGYPSIAGAEGDINPPGRIKDSHFDLFGLWNVTEANQDYIEAVFSVDNGSFYSAVKNKSLKDLEYNGINYPGGIGATDEQVCAYITSLQNNVYPQSDYTCYCAYMPSAREDMEGDYSFVNPIAPVNTGAAPFLRIDSVYMFAGAVVDYIFSEHGYKVVTNAFKSGDLSRLTIFNTRTNNVFREFMAGFRYSAVLPDIPVTDFLKALTNRFNLGFFINEQSKSVSILTFDEIITKSPRRIEFAPKTVKLDKNRYTGISLGLDAPDTWSESNIESIDDLAPYPIVEVNKFRDIVPGPGVSGNIYYVKGENAYYRIKYENSAYSASRIGSAIIPYETGEDPQEIEQLSGIPGMYTHTIDFEFIVAGETYDTPVDYVLPYTDLEGVDDTGVSPDFPLMFLFAWGRQHNYIVPANGAPMGLMYPMASNGVYDATGAKITVANQSLAWNDTYGLVPNLWNNRILWELNLKETHTVNIPIDEFNKLADFTSPVRIGKSNYLVDSFSIEISGNICRITDLKLFRL